MNIQDKIVCPKCNTRGLRKSHGVSPKGEMFCDKDHEYLTIWELVNIWKYDAGDFVNQNNRYIGSTLLPKITSWENILDLEDINNQLTSYEISSEPMWLSSQEREEAYEIVHRMFMGIPEYDEYQDLKNTQECALDRGVQ